MADSNTPTKNRTPEGMYPVGDFSDPKSTSPTGYKELSRDAAALTLGERTQIMTEITKTVGAERVKALQEASKALDEWNRKNPNHTAHEHSASAAFKKYRAVLEPIQDDVNKIMEKHGLVNRGFGGKDNPPPIINNIVGKDGRRTAPENDPGFVEVMRRARNDEMFRGVIKNMETPPKQQPGMEPAVPMATSGAAIPARTPGGRE